MTEQIRSWLKRLTPEDRNGVLRELLVAVLAEMDGERAVLDDNGEVVGYLLPTADRMKLEARTVESLEVFQQGSDKDEHRYTTPELLERLHAAE